MSPARIAWSMITDARRPEAQTLLMVSDETSLGMPACSAPGEKGSTGRGYGWVAYESSERLRDALLLYGACFPTAVRQ